MRTRALRTQPATPGERFGKLTVFGPAIQGAKGNYLPCMCDCQTPIFVLWRILNSGGRTSCGNCKIAFKKERLYTIWSGMKSRCDNPDGKAWVNYGQRGITYTSDWGRYLPFRAWALTSGYADNLTLERIDNDGNYEPANCTWITPAAQARNRRSSITLSLDGEIKILSEWSQDPRCVVKYHTLYARIKNGWELGNALSVPAGNTLRDRG
jgi:hypothetical protein